MADIKQAAKWLDEGRCVTRLSWLESFDVEQYISYRNGKLHTCFEDGPFCWTALQLEDLIAEDWELFEKIKDKENETI